MYNIKVSRSLKNDVEELIKVFLHPGDFAIEETEEEITDKSERNAVKRQVYEELSAMTGMRPPWGILTGVRPVKLTGEIKASGRDPHTVLRDEYLLSEEKNSLLTETLDYQQEVCQGADRKSVGLYIGIPFCPTRCLYCSFTSNQKPESEILRYLEALKTEIRYVGRRMKETGAFAESVYIGGGTPTTLSAGQMDDLLETVFASIDLSACREFTVEAGRPDTITIDKLRVIKNHGITRISINPQTMHNETLELIGRDHKSNDITEAFDKANSVGLTEVNADLIAGLPGETPEMFKETLRQIIGLKPANITVHTLAVKRASRLVEQDPDYHYRQGETVSEMLGIAKQMLMESGYRPYYLYRQKHMAGALENVGWCRDNTPCIYNIRIMDEHQSILALGAGGISKIYFPEENRLERVPNVSNYEVYIDRLDEMLERKEKNFFAYI